MNNKLIEALAEVTILFAGIAFIAYTVGQFLIELTNVTF